MFAAPDASHRPSLALTPSERASSYCMLTCTVAFDANAPPMLPEWWFIKVYRPMWVFGGVAACDMVMTVRWELAHISNDISILQSTSVRRTVSGVFLVFVYFRNKGTRWTVL